jgi:hypothetical protein
MGQVQQVEQVPNDFACPDCGGAYMDGMITHASECPLKDLPIEELVRIAPDYNPDAPPPDPDVI